MKPPSETKALVTGSSSGIGLAIARLLLAKGHAVVGLSRRPSEPLLQETGYAQVLLDLADLESLPGRLQELSRVHRDVEILVFCAGRGQFGSLEEFSYDGIREVLELNFLSHAYLARAFLPALKRRGSGHLVFIGSESAHRGAQRGSVYCASKFALRGFAQALREEASRGGVRVSFISPGMTRSPFFDRLDFEPGDDPANYLEPEDVAEAVWLAVSARKPAVMEEIRLTPLKKVVRKRRRRG